MARGTLLMLSISKTAESEGEVYHPTQKPVELGRYSFVPSQRKEKWCLDNTCGSGSFLVSAVLEEENLLELKKRRCLSVSRNIKLDYIEVSKKRIKEAESSIQGRE